MMEIIIRLEQNEVGRLFTTLGGGLMQLMGQRAGGVDPLFGQNADNVEADAAGRLRRTGVPQLARGINVNEVRSVGDVQDLLSRLQSDQGGQLFPPVEGECDHRYAYLHTEHGSDIYVCQRDGCERRMTIPGRIVQPAPIEETPEVLEDETRDSEERNRHGQPPGLPPGESEEVVSQDPPPE